jgi:hypothetical protein
MILMRHNTHTKFRFPAWQWCNNVTHCTTDIWDPSPFSLQCRPCIIQLTWAYENSSEKLPVQQWQWSEIDRKFETLCTNRAFIAGDKPSSAMKEWVFCLWDSAWNEYAFVSSEKYDYGNARGRATEKILVRVPALQVHYSPKIAD